MFLLAYRSTQVRFVKCLVFNHGYRRLKFYHLPSDGSLGSKELLLVFSWLLCRVSLVKQSLTLNRVKLWDEIVVCMCDTLVKSLQFERNVDPAADVKGHRDIRYLQWLNGQLEFQWRNCHTEQQEQCKLLHELLHFIESDNSRLEAFLKWKPMEPVYWHWMDTVLDSETKEAKAQDICNKDTVLLCADLCCSGLSRTIEDLERCRSDLVTLREELHELVMYKKRNSCRKVRAREQEQLGEKELNRTIKRIEAAVDLKLSDLKCHNHVCTVKKIHGPYRLVFKGKCLKGHKMDSIKSAATNKAITKGITAEDVITDLRKQEAKLKAELKQQQEKSRNKLHEAVKKLNHMLFIPPMRRQKARDKDTIQFGKVC
ncbi:hypothetical protein JD844_017204 [Phrynosoma platyrhinos]|uniref:Tubulin epsilon and delta complex protein 1 domain-containing protein n=1 Tax=Phrynosoma platyrhinos TaxID=52577 RepID=A0ABQ7SLM4_PHRPL|nr:hypothetical protein JD844_017204 [Phrynosoma platyrhinos]